MVSPPDQQAVSPPPPRAPAWVQASARDDFFGFGGKAGDEFSDDPDDPFGLGEAAGYSGGRKLRIHIKVGERA